MLPNIQTQTNQGLSLNQARIFPEKFNSWLGGAVLSLNENLIILLGQGVILRAPYSGKNVSVGDKVLVQISREDFKKWLKNEDHVMEEVVKIKPLSPHRNSKAPHLLHHHRYQLIERWSKFLEAVKGFFKDKGFTETPTPSLVQCPGMEATLEPFVTTLSVGEKQRELFLPTSPELHLKKLLAQGWSEIFEVKQCFRNGELSCHHQPEFTMLEWYRTYDSLHSIAQDIMDLISELDEKGFVLRAKGERKQNSVSQLFLEYTDIELTPLTTREELAQYSNHIGQPVNENDTWDDIFHLIFITQIENQLGKTGPELVYNFPASQAALAQINEDGWADRFELYWRGMEIGNAFNELVDPVEQRTRFIKEIALRKHTGKTQVPIDEEFIEALERGLPPCAGMAVGLERLFLACQDMYELEKTTPISHSSERSLTRISHKFSCLRGCLKSPKRGLVLKGNQGVNSISSPTKLARRQPQRGSLCQTEKVACPY